MSASCVHGSIFTFTSSSLFSICAYTAISKAQCIHCFRQFPEALRHTSVNKVNVFIKNKNNIPSGPYVLKWQTEKGQEDSCSTTCLQFVQDTPEKYHLFAYLEITLCLIISHHCIPAGGYILHKRPTETTQNVGDTQV